MVNRDIHPSAIIDTGASIGLGTKVWHWVHICSGARIGTNCSLGQNVFIGNDVQIGNGVKIQNNVSVYDSVVLEDGVFCGPSVVFTNVKNPRSEINRKHEYKKTLIREGATLGANSTIICGLTVGRYSLVGAGCVVTKNVPDYALVVGVPNIQVGWVNEAGVQLDLPLIGYAETFCKETRSLYKLTNGLLKKEEHNENKNI